MEETGDFNLAILYWFYKEPEITKNHLEIIRKNNPDRKIYGLFGGDPADAGEYRDVLNDLLDDFWTYPGTYGDDQKTKWIHGDLVLLDWYDKRGRDLVWDSIAITQWDMLVFADIGDITPGIRKSQVFFSGYRDLDSGIENSWNWTRPDKKYRQNYLAFRQYVATEYSYTERIRCCLYVFEVLTHDFFEAYLNMSDKKIGMLEYKDPTFASAIGLDIYEHDVGVYWGDKGVVEDFPLNAASVNISKTYIDKELKKIDGWRLFHPYESTW